MRNPYTLCMCERCVIYPPKLSADRLVRRLVSVDFFYGRLPELHSHQTNCLLGNWVFHLVGKQAEVWGQLAWKALGAAIATGAAAIKVVVTNGWKIPMLWSLSHSSETDCFSSLCRSFYHMKKTNKGRLKPETSVMLDRTLHREF